MKTHECGIVGLPNVGKSSLFNFLTKSNQAKSENYPFCTIEPNEAMVFYEDSRLKTLREFSKSEKIVESYIKFKDIAGLVEGASNGEGLGNKFLAHIREVDIILHVVRCFDDGQVTHVMDEINPIKDLEIILTELRLADKETIENMKKKSRNADLTKELERIENLIDNESTEIISDLPLLSCKPFIVLGNGNSPELVKKLSEYCLKKGIKFVNFNIAEKDLKNITILLKEVFALLKIIFFFTTGKIESRSWAIKEETTAKESAREIHNDISEKFIKAEVFNFNEINTKYRVRQEGKEYKVKDGDIINFKHNG